MGSPEMLAEVVDRSTNLWQLDLVLSPKRVQDMRFGEIAERQPRVSPIGKFNDGLGSAARAGSQWIRASCHPGTKSVLGNL
jgi:hypothetical protein